MRRAVGFTVVALVATMLVTPAASAAPATRHRGPVPAAALRASSTPRAPGKASVPAIGTAMLPSGAAALAAGVEGYEIPAAAAVRNSLHATTNHIDYWAVYLYPGTQVSLSLTGSEGTDFYLALWDNTTTSSPVAESGYYGYPQTLTYDVTAEDFYYFFVYANGTTGSYTLSYSLTDPAVASPITRVQGANRYTTALAASSAFATSSAVIVATGANYADALAASGLAGSYDCPVLLTTPNALSPGVLERVNELGATSVFVVGSGKAVATPVADALATPTRTVTRLAGATRYETAARVADQIAVHDGPRFNPKAFIVSGANFPDALSISPFAFSQRMPVLLAQKRTLPVVTASEIASLGITDAYVIGSDAVIDEFVRGQIAVTNKPRISGADRFATSKAAADFAVGAGWADWGVVGLSTAYNYPDALGGGPNIGREHGVLLLCHPTFINYDAYVGLYDNRADVTAVRVFGGGAAILCSVVGDADYALQGTPPEAFYAP